MVFFFLVDREGGVCVYKGILEKQKEKESQIIRRKVKIIIANFFLSEVLYQLIVRDFTVVGRKPKTLSVLEVQL